MIVGSHENIHATPDQRLNEFIRCTEVWITMIRGPAECELQVTDGHVGRFEDWLYMLKAFGVVMFFCDRIECGGDLCIVLHDVADEK